MLAVLTTTLIMLHDPSSAAPLPSDARVTVGSSVHFVNRDIAELERELRNSFDLTDRNRDGRIDLGEAPIAERGQTNANGERVAEEAGNTLWIRLMDTDGDVAVDWQEMRTYLLPRIIRANTQRQDPAYPPSATNPPLPKPGLP